MKSNEQILRILKLQGPQSAKALATVLQLTTMGVRQHLLGLEQQGKVSFEDRAVGRGRPERFWALTERANDDFENRHEELTVQLLDSVRNVFGEEGLDSLIRDREQKMREVYACALEKQRGLKNKLQELVRLRNEEGYMASIVEDDGGWWLLESHCPICAAANHCMSFCRSELELFQFLLSGLGCVRRTEHILEGSRRCAYRITSTATWES